LNISIKTPNVNGQKPFFFAYELRTLRIAILKPIPFLNYQHPSGGRMQDQQPAVPSSSLMSRLINVFTSPAEAFEGIETSPSKASTWLVPMIAALIISIFISYLLVSNETLRAQMMDAQKQTMQKMVESGRVTQQQADMQAERMESMGTGMFMAFAIVGSLVFICLYYFGASLFLWLGGKFVLKSTAGYGKYLELYGISAWVGILGAVITVLMILAMNSMYASPSASLAVMGEYDPTNNTHRLLTSANIFSIWQVILVGFGLSKLSGKSLGLSIGVAFILWLIWVPISVFLGLAR
jgi:hypothetical protein